MCFLIDTELLHNLNLLLKFFEVETALYVCLCLSVSGTRSLHLKCYDNVSL